MQTCIRILGMHILINACIISAMMILCGFTASNYSEYDMHFKQIFKQAIDHYQAKYLLNANLYISKNGELIFESKRGFADIDQQREFTNETPFPIASLTKQFTASAILLLKEQGKLDLNQAIITYLKATHPIWQRKVPEWAYKVTPHHLLTHSSGIADYTDKNWDHLMQLSDQEIMPAIITALKDQPLAFPVGSKFSYNNTGYLLLSAIITELSPEQDMSKFLENHILRKANMKQTYLPSINAERVYMRNIYANSKLPIHYIANIEDPKLEPTTITTSKFHAPYCGGGAMVSTASDLIAWNQALYSGRLLASDSIKLMTTPYIASDDYLFENAKFGYGIMVNDSIGETIYSHGGWITGIRMELSYNPKNQVTVLIMSNLSPDEQQSEEIQSRQAKSLLDLALELQKLAKDL